MASLLKWKFTHLNSVDFPAQVERAAVRVSRHRRRDARGGARAVGRVDADEEPRGRGRGASIPATPRVASLDGKIVECDLDGTGTSARGGSSACGRIRTTSNFVTVYRRTLEELILDDITSDEIVGFVADALEERRIARENRVQAHAAGVRARYHGGFFCQGEREGRSRAGDVRDGRGETDATLNDDAISIGNYTDP